MLRHCYNYLLRTRGVDVEADVGLVVVCLEGQQAANNLRCNLCDGALCHMCGGMGILKEEWVSKPEEQSASLWSERACEVKCGIPDARAPTTHYLVVAPGVSVTVPVQYRIKSTTVVARQAYPGSGRYNRYSHVRMVHGCRVHGVPPYTPCHSRSPTGTQCAALEGS